MTFTATAREAEAAPPASALYRAVWRWHFYAGLLILPFMVSLAITGGLYLYKDEINRIVYHDALIVAPSALPSLAPSELLARATDAVPGTAVRYVLAATPESSVEVGIETADRGTLSLYLNPYSGAVLGQIADTSKLMWIIRKLHSLDYFGWLANRVIEMVAGWALVLVVTGVYLWWPRKRTGGVFAMRLKRGGRVFWRDLHAVTGAYAALFIFFLALTGLPWSGYWGSQLNGLLADNGLGYPPEFWDAVPTSTVPMKEAMSQISWTLENAPMPESRVQDAAPIGIDRAIATFERLGLARGYVVDLPNGPQGVYSASVFPDQVAREQVVHLDQYSGEPLFNGGFEALGGGAKAIEWGISVHMGQEYGLLNQVAMTAACLCILVMAVAAVAMWWKRRPHGSLGAPRIPGDFRLPRAVFLVTACLGILFPLVGASLLVVLTIDWMLPRPLKERFG